MNFRGWLLTEEKSVKVAHIKINLPDVRQSHNFDCGPACLRSICQYYKVGPKTEQAFIELIETSKEGSHPNDIVKAAKKLGLNAEFHDRFSVKRLKKSIDARRPTICEIQAWGNPKNYHKLNDGHFVVAIGYDDENLYFEDPSIKNIRGYIPIEEFEKRWEEVETNGDHFHHSVIVIWKDEKSPKQTILNKAKYIE